MGKRRFSLTSAASYVFTALTVLIVVLHFVFGFQYAVILTDSMEPHINSNDLIVTAPVSGNDLRTGEVIMYHVTLGNSTYQIVHRIVGVQSGSSGVYYVTRGDNRNYTDPWKVYPDQVVGKVVLVVPRVGVVWYYTPLIVLAIFILIIASLAYDIALMLLEEEPLRPKSRKAHLLVVRRKKIKVYYHRR